MKQIPKYIALIFSAALLLPVFVYAQTNEELSEEALPKSGIGEAPLSAEKESTSGLIVPIEIFDLPEVEDLPEDEGIPVAEIEIPGLSIQTEQISWNTFSFRPSLPFGEEPESYKWNFGDNSSSRQRVAEHSYKGPGNYMVELAVVMADGAVQKANTQVNIGFFHLANWRLWLMLGGLALIIIAASAFAGLNEEESVKKKKKAPSLDNLKRGDETVINTLAEATGDFDIWVSTGIHKDELKEELKIIEEINGRTKKKKRKAPAKKASAKTRKKAVKKRSTKKRVTKKKKK